MSFVTIQAILLSYILPSLHELYFLTWSPNENSNHPAYPCSLIRAFVVRMKKLLGYLITPSWDVDQNCANAHANLNSLGVHVRTAFTDVVAHTRVLQKVLSLGSDYSSATFIKHVFIANLQSIPPLLKHIFVTFLPSREKQINSLLLVSVGDTDK